MKKKVVSMIVALVMLVASASMLVGCGKDKGGYDLYIAGLKGAYGEAHWTALAKAFEEKTGKKVKVEINSKIEDLIEPQLKAGNGPDVIYCAKGRPAKLTERLLEANQIEDITGLLSSKVTGSTKTLDETLMADAKLGMKDGDKLFTIPYFVGLNGIFYNADNFYANDGNGSNGAKTNGKYELPSTWKEFLELGAALEAERTAATGDAAKKVPALFTYPTAGYLDALIPASIASNGGVEKLNKCFAYEDGIWLDAEVKAVFENLAATKPYVYKNCVVNGMADGGWLQNQQTIIDNKTLFMCNGDWVKGEMEKTTPATFNWGTMPYLAFDKNGAKTTRYTSTVYEQIYIPTSANNKALAKEFLLYAYSADAQKIVAKESNSAMLATADYAINAKGIISDGALEGYKGYYDGSTKTIATNGFKAVENMPADSAGWNTIMCEELQNVWGVGGSGTVTAQQWVEKIEALSDIRRAHIKA